MNVRSFIGLVLVGVLGSTSPVYSMASGLSKLKPEEARLSPNGNFALWCRITKMEWIKKSWKIPLYPFAILIGGKKVPLRWGFNTKCTVVNKDRKDLFDWPYGSSRPIWSPDGNKISGSGGTSKAYILTESRSVDVPTHSRSVWLGDDQLLLVSLMGTTANISTFDVLTEQRVELAAVQLPYWAKTLGEINNCSGRLKILVDERYSPSGVMRNSVLNWDVASRTLIETRNYNQGVDGLTDVRTCSK